MLSSLRNLREALTPVASSNDFKETGQLLPEEFVSAGNYLNDKFPDWVWHSGDKDRMRSYLPPNKQYLIRKNVACPERASSLETGPQEDTEDGFIKTFSSNKQEGPTPDISEALETPEIASADTSEFPDMDDCVVPDDEDDQDVLRSPHLVPKRSYDVLITYDKYYRTPRVWLYGWSETGSPLGAREVCEDISGDHLSKTVTMEPFPHSTSGNLMASVHPCKHASSMKAFLDRENRKKLGEAEKQSRAETSSRLRAAERAKQEQTLQEALRSGQKSKIVDDEDYVLMDETDIDSDNKTSEVGIRVDQYLIVFLKFIGTITPTIDHEVGGFVFD